MVGKNVILSPQNLHGLLGILLQLRTEFRKEIHWLKTRILTLQDVSGVELLPPNLVI